MRLKGPLTPDVKTKCYLRIWNKQFFTNNFAQVKYKVVIKCGTGSWVGNNCALCISNANTDG
jgi:hypothetical protein